MAFLRRNKAAQTFQSQDEQQPIGLWMRFFHRSLLVAVLLGIVFLFISYTLIPIYVPFVGAAFLKVLTHELGFALIVASTIWVSFEFFVQADSDEHWNERIERISRSVFFGVFKRNFPDAFIREANLLVLEQRLIRTGLNVTYTITDASYARDGQQHQFVKLNAVARFKVRNVANTHTDFPLGIVLPNPMIDEMKAHCRVNKISTRIHDVLKLYDLAAANEAFRVGLQDDTKSHISFGLENIRLSPDQEIEVVIDYVMAKEDEDNEVFQTIYPADSLNLTVMDQGATTRVVRARAIHLAELVDDTAAEVVGTYNFKLDRYLLPRQGFAIWWKKVPVRRPAEPDRTNPGLGR